jgi:PilZ domain-containing protein
MNLVETSKSDNTLSHRFQRVRKSIRDAMASGELTRKLAGGLALAIGFTQMQRVVAVPRKMQMTISTCVFTGIIGHPGIGYEHYDARRLAVRVAVSKRATLSRRGSNGRIPLTIVNVSTNGAGFMYLTPLTAGSQLTLRVTGRTGDHLTIQCIVVWCKKTGSGRFRIGAEFLRLLDQNEDPQTI